MSSYKVSYKMLGQHADDMIKLANQLGSDISTLESIVPKISESDMFRSLKADLNKLIGQLNDNCDLMGTSGNILKECAEEYTNTEVKLVQKSEATKAHSRDFYKNPVSIAATSGGSVNTAPIGATTLDAGGSYSYTSTSSGGDTSGAASGASSYSTRNDAGGGSAVFTTREATVGGGAGNGAAVMAGAAAGAGVAAAGLGGAFAAKKIKEKQDEKKNAEAQKAKASSTAPTPKDDYDPADELAKAKARLADLSK